MNTCKLIIARRAHKDLAEALQLSELTFGAKHREIYSAKILEGYIRITKMPHIGHRRKDIPNGMLSYVAGQHSIIYRINEKESLVMIYRLLHVKMDFTNKL